MELAVGMEITMVNKAYYNGMKGKIIDRVPAGEDARVVMDRHDIPRSWLYSSAPITVKDRWLILVDVKKDGILDFKIAVCKPESAIDKS